MANGKDTVKPKAPKKSSSKGRKGSKRGVSETKGNMTPFVGGFRP